MRLLAHALAACCLGLATPAWADDGEGLPTGEEAASATPDGGADVALGVGASGASPPALLPEDDHRLHWDPAWFEAGTWEGIGAFSLALGSVVLKATIPLTTSTNFEGGWLFDDAVRDALLIEDKSTRILTARISDWTWYGLQAYPVLIDALVVALIADENPEVAYQLLVMDAFAMGFAGLATAVVQQRSGRERPLTDECERDPDYGECTGRLASLYSGHTALAATGAGLICLQHSYLPLYGSEVADVAACGAAAAVAASNAVMRITSDKHWATDVLIGIGVGTVSGWLLPYLLWFHGREPALPEVGGAAIFPYGGPGGGGLRALGRF